MENGNVLEVLEKIKKYGVRYNGAIKVGEITDLIEWQQAEIERLTEEQKTLIWLNQSLEKQVDELKELKEMWRLEFVNERTWGKSAKIRQAVKDTAKEILDMIDSVPTNEVNELNHLRLLKNAIVKRYGTEVE